MILMAEAAAVSQKSGGRSQTGATEAETGVEAAPETETGPNDQISGRGVDHEAVRGASEIGTARIEIAAGTTHIEKTDDMMRGEMTGTHIGAADQDLQKDAVGRIAMRKRTTETDESESMKKRNGVQNRRRRNRSSLSSRRLILISLLSRREFL